MAMYKVSFCAYAGCKAPLPRKLERTRRKYCSEDCRNAFTRGTKLTAQIDGGYIYAIDFGQPDSPIKIGWSNDPKKRLQNLQYHHPYSLRLLGFRPGTRSDECELQARFKHLRLLGEWFNSSAVLRELIDEWKLN
jgi:hypothetical protein